MKLQLIAWLLLLGIVMVPAVSHAETFCSWLNNATATGVLGGPVTLKVQNTAAGGNACLFQYRQKNTIYDLDIVVHDINSSTKVTVPAPLRCNSQVLSLRGIGNEAAMCSADSASFHGERVTGRVRDKKFVIRLGSSMRKNPTMTKEMLQVEVKSIAEQVTGTLF